jgi:serine/threonine-protein kinase
MKTCKTCQRTYSTHFANCPQDGTPLLLSDDWADGTLIRGKYKIIQKVGQGAMGAVYKALHMHFDEIRALKVIATQLSTDKTFVKRFEQEAILARRLQHPSAVRVDDIDETEDGQPFIVMEFIEGKSLRSVMNTEGPMNPQRVCAIVKQVASALDAANKLGIVHRDIKPGNVMVTPDGHVKVLDFGIARTTDGVNLTQTASVLGTAPYMSPEQAMGQPADARSDIYSLGCVLYEMLTGKPPFMGDLPAAVLHQHVRVAPKSPRAVNPNVPPALDALVLEMLAKSPDDRPQTAAEVRDRLAGLDSTTAATTPLPPAPPPTMRTVPLRPAPAPDPVPPTRAVTPPRREGGPAAWVVFTVIALLLLGAAVAYAVTRGDSGKSSSSSSHSTPPTTHVSTTPPPSTSASTSTSTSSSTPTTSSTPTSTSTSTTSSTTTPTTTLSSTTTTPLGASTGTSTSTPPGQGGVPPGQAKKGKK